MASYEDPGKNKQKQEQMKTGIDDENGFEDMQWKGSGEM
jgi:hypothetical protein